MVKKCNIDVGNLSVKSIKPSRKVCNLYHILAYNDMIIVYLAPFDWLAPVFNLVIKNVIHSGILKQAAYIFILLYTLILLTDAKLCLTLMYLARG